MKTKADLIKQEVLSIKKLNNGIVKPEHLVEFAQDPSTTLHSQFQWDDSVAGHKYRLWQARQILNTIVFIEPNLNKEMRVYCSLYSDRYNGGGYRDIVAVMKHQDSRAERLQQALEEFQRWEQKYQDISELSAIYEAAQQVQKKLRTKQKQPA